MITELSSRDRRFSSTSNTQASNKTARVSVPRLRSGAALAFAPLFAVAALCLFTSGQRFVTERLHPLGSPGERAVISAADVDHLAQTVCVELTGAPGRPRDASMQFAYSRRRGSLIREWNVICDTEKGQYLLRINAMTGRVYAINRLTVTDATTTTAPPADREATAAEAEETAAESAPEAQTDSLAGSSALTRPQAEARALRYLALMGIPAHGLSTVVENGPVPGANARQWNFTFRRNVPGLGPRLLKVSVDGKDGDLDDAWNPVYAL